MNRRNLAVAVAGIAGVAALAVIALVLVNRTTPLSPRPSSPSAPSVQRPPTQTADGSAPSEAEMAAVALVIENELGLKEVLLSQFGTTLELRFRSPGLSPSDTLALLAGLFDWLDAAAPAKAAEDIRIVMTVNGSDAAFAEASRASIRDWRAGTLSSEQFVSSWERVSLVSAE